MEQTPTTIEAWTDDSHDRATRKGFHDPTKSFGEEVALVCSEACEALEEHRDGHGYTEIYWKDLATGTTYANRRVAGPGKVLKPEGIPVELADVVIRVMDMCGKYGIDLQEAMTLKAAFNETRPHRHGKKNL